MKKIIRTICGIVVIASLCINVCNIANALESDSEFVNDEVTQKGNKLRKLYEEEKVKETNSILQDKCRHEKEEESIEAYECLMEKICDDTMLKYKSYYAGAYIDDEQRLVVHVNKKGEKIVEKIGEMTKSENVSVDIVRYSYNELKTVYDKISDEMRKKEKI